MEKPMHSQTTDYAARGRFPTQVETEDRFTRILNELARGREEQARKWDEQARKWDEQARKWDEQVEKWDEQDRRWEEQNRTQALKWDEQNRKWDEQNRKWEMQKQEDRRNWEESNRRFDQMSKKIDRSIGALGARWGIQSERAFRDALAGILVESFGVEVINVNEFDDEGEVFGDPDQIEIDVIIKNGLLILCELKSSMSQSDMRTFHRKILFYERRHRRRANRMIAISPMIDDRARRVGKELGIEMYPDSLDVPVKIS